MEQVLIDTNAILSFLTDRNIEQKNLVLALAEKSRKGEMEIILHQHVISETIFTLLNVYRIGKETVVEVLEDLIGHPGIIVENHLSWTEVFALWSKVIPDIGDAVVGAVARKAKYRVFTFDKKFAKKLESLGVIAISAI